MGILCTDNSYDKEYLEINVKNDEQLVKLFIVQRKEGKQGSESEFLSESEKEQLLNNVQKVEDDLQDHSDFITSKSGD